MRTSATPGDIREACSAPQVEQARLLFREYADGLGIDLCFQGFERELAMLPGDYAPPRGRLLLTGSDADPCGCIALRPLAVGERPSGSVGEIKRLYLRPEARGSGAGRRLVEALLVHARAIGYRELRLDTLAQMTAARALYASLGFRAIPAYYANPLPGVLYMALDLEAAGK